MKKSVFITQQVCFSMCLEVNTIFRTKSIADSGQGKLKSLNSQQIRFFNFYATGTTITTSDTQIHTTPSYKDVSKYYTYTSSGSTMDKITITINNVDTRDIEGPFTNDHIGVFLYKNNKYNLLELFYMDDIVENPIDKAAIYENDTLWRVVHLPPVSTHGLIESPYVQTISGGCKECRSTRRICDYTDSEFYIDSGSFAQNYTLVSLLLDGTTSVITKNIPLQHWGIYTNVIFNETGQSELQLYSFTDLESDYFWWPLITLGQLFVLICICRSIYLCIKERKAKMYNFSDLENKYLNVDEQIQKDIVQEVKVPTKEIEIPPSQKKERLQCLDTFRGMSIFGMVFVNYQGGNYEFFNHSLWNGLSFADIIFPFFMWIMGVSCAQAMKREYKNEKWTSTKRILIRSLKLFQLGIVVDQNWNQNTFRIMGVLQRFAFAYLFIGLLIIYLPVHDRMDPFKTPRFHLRTLIAAVLPITAILVTFQTQYHNCPYGYIGPGGQSLPEGQGHCIGGMNQGIDQGVFTPEHIYQTPTAQVIYKSGAYDPEGLLGSLNSSFLTFLGLIVGEYIVVYDDTVKRSFFLLGTSIVLVAAALGLSGFTMVGGIIPINKNVWSFSFVQFNAGLANFVFWVCLILEKHKQWCGWPFGYLGLNAIMIYVGHELMTGKFPFGFETSGRHFPALFSSLLGVFLWSLLAYYWFNIKWFVKV